LDEAELERELLEDSEIEILHEWRLLHLKANMVASEASGSSPAPDIGTSLSIPTAATTSVPAYNPDKPEILITALE